MSYKNDTEFAMRNLIELAMREETELNNRSRVLQEAEARLRVHQWDFQSSDLNDDFSDAYVMAAFARAGRAGEEVSAIQREVARLQATVGAQQHSIQAICGSILQIAKQGISLVHGDLAAAPQGRILGTSSLKDIVWQARNQALHYEDGRFNPAVTVLFASLAASHGPQFSLATHAGLCLARQIVHLLGWQTYDQYVADARLLGF